jgi:toxin-antitoxin system PIN domain toxin
MKLVDLNILLYAVDQDAAHHQRVRRWLEASLADDEPVGLTWLVLVGFVRLVTRPGVFRDPLSVEQAISIVDDWLAQPSVAVVQESEEHWRHLRDHLRETGTAGNLTTDAHLASIAIANGATLVSCDADFGRFRKLRWENPIATE